MHCVTGSGSNGEVGSGTIGRFGGEHLPPSHAADRSVAVSRGSWEDARTVRGRARVRGEVGRWQVSLRGDRGPAGGKIMH